MLRKVTHCAGRILANTRPHQLYWGDGGMGPALNASGGWPYPKDLMKLLKTPSFCAAVQCAAICNQCVIEQVAYGITTIILH